MDDNQIEYLLSCKKTITNPRARFRSALGTKQKTFDLVSESGAKFQVYLRQNERLAHNFSCGLIFHQDSTESIHLTRYNGGSHTHSNPIEGSKLGFVCHIHRATARYIAAGKRPEHFAEETDRFYDLNGALLALVLDCNIMGLPGSSKDDQSSQDLFEA